MPSTFNTSSVYGTYLVPKTELVNSSVLRTEELPKIRNFGARLVSRAKEKRAYLGPASRAQPDEQKWPWRKSGLLARKSSNMHKRGPAIGHHTGPNPLNCRISMEIVSILRFGDGLDGGETGIRTLGRLAPTTVFETVPFDHSGTSPHYLVVSRIPMVNTLASSTRNFYTARKQKSYNRTGICLQST